MILTWYSLRSTETGKCRSLSYQVVVVAENRFTMCRPSLHVKRLMTVLTVICHTVCGWLHHQLDSKTHSRIITASAFKTSSLTSPDSVRATA